MLSCDGNEGSKKTVGLISKKKKKSLHEQHSHFLCTFLCRCFTRLQRETSRNFLVTRFMEEMSYVFLFNVDIKNKSKERIDFVVVVFYL